MATADAPHHLPTPPSTGGTQPAAVLSLIVLLRLSTAMAVLLAVASFPRSAFFRVTDIIVTGTRQVAAADLIALSGVRTGDLLFAIPASDVAFRTARHPGIATARVTVRPSGQVLITVTERGPRAVVPYQRTLLVVDRDGVVLEARGDRGGLPLLRIEGLALPWVRVGDVLPAPQVAHALGVLQRLPPTVLSRLTEIRMDAAEEFAVVTSDGVPVLLGPLRGLAARAAIMPEVLAAIRRQKMTARYLDLRFSGNVVLKPAGNAQGAGDGP